MEGMNPSARRAARRSLVIVLLVGCIVASGFGNGRQAAAGKPVDRITVRGTATLDGAPLDAEFLGAVVGRNGMTTPCQSGIPGVTRGRYVITVLGERAGRGCGRRGAEVLLWTYVGDTKLYSTTALRWPGRGNSARFNPQFSSATPNGAAPPVTELSGEVFDQNGRRLPPGTRVDAYIETTRCGVASVRRAESFVGYVLSVVGPDSISGCAQGAEITFKINGRPANETSLNHLEGGGPGRGGSFRLTQSSAG
jgi:hypothetical protein